jgi:hypothetical protein
MDSQTFIESAVAKYTSGLEAMERQKETMAFYRDEMIRAWNKGMYESVKNEISYVANGGWTYVTLPLNKQIFMGYVGELEATGWKAGELNLGEKHASMMLRTDPESYSRSLTLVLQAYGEGVACRIVEVEPQIDYKEGTYEWVCEDFSEEEAKNLWNKEPSA